MISLKIVIEWTHVDCVGINPPGVDILYILQGEQLKITNINPEVLREFLKYSSIPDTILHKITKRKGRYLNATISDTDTHTVRDQLL